MSFFKKVLGSVGIGAAKVDAILDDKQFSPGEKLTGVIQIKGGKVEQEINKIDLELCCNYTEEKEDEEGESILVENTYTLAKLGIEAQFTITPSEEKVIPFEFNLPLETPLTVGESETWLKTNLDIDMALDKSDRDYFHVVPNRLQHCVIDAMHEIGFELYKSDCEGISSAHFSKVPFVQELEFKTVSGDFHGRFDEVEIVFILHNDRLDVLLEIDRRARGIKSFFAEALGLDESKARLVVTAQSVESLAEDIYAVLESNS